MFNSNIKGYHMNWETPQYLFLSNEKVNTIAKRNDVNTLTLVNMSKVVDHGLAAIINNKSIALILGNSEPHGK